MLIKDNVIHNTKEDTIDQPINTIWLNEIFPSKGYDKINEWVHILHEQEFEGVLDLVNLDEESWKELPLPIAVKSALKNHIKISSVPNDESVISRPLQQIDCIVIDISGSMKARSSIDVDKSREDVSKLFFHTMMDKLVSLELFHAIGLLAFGEATIPVPITREYEKFHDELGRLDASQCRTKLFDSVLEAADIIDVYHAAYLRDVEAPLNVELPKIMKRIFVLTDGQDNYSKNQPWKVAQTLQQKGIILDVIPLAGYDLNLHAVALTSGGLCFDVVSQEQGMQLFENEATLHVDYREEIDGPPLINDSSDFNAYCNTLKTVFSKESRTTEIKTAVPKSAFTPLLSQSEAKAASETGQCKSTTSRQVTRRILKEYSQITANPINGVSVYLDAVDISKWKVTITDLPYPYCDGIWVLTVDYPCDYPFSPMKIRFITPIYHCNISSGGYICLDVLKDNWNPTLTISKAMLSIQSLLLNPNSDDPLDAYKGVLLKDNKEIYELEAEKFTNAHNNDNMELIKRLNLEK